MNAKSLAPFMLANTTVVIDINGDVRELLPGEIPGPGEVIVILGHGATANADSSSGIEAQLVGEDGNLDLNLDNEIASIIEQIEQGVDPTQNEDFATAAGGQISSSLTGSGDIERIQAETIAQTQFDTIVLESQGLSRTQSLTLIEIVAAELTSEPEAPVFDLDSYGFSYDENSASASVLGTVSATAGEGGTVTYSLVFDDDDPLSDYFDIAPDSGEILLTDAGAEALTNDFEDQGGLNVFEVLVQASDGENISQVVVTLTELDVNELPVSEDFSIDAGDASVVPVVFDSEGQSLDQISDQDDDFNAVELNVMITSLPQYGTLLYSNEFGVTRSVTQADLYVPGQEIDSAKLFDPNNFTYVAGLGDRFEIGHSGDPAEIVLDEDGFYNWGNRVSDTERLITLDNGKTIGISIEDNKGKPLKQYTGGSAHIGWGIGDTDGKGLNKKETLVVDLSDNPLEVVTFGLDGMGGAFKSNSKVYVEVTYTFADDTTHVEQYQKDQGDVGNRQILYEFSYSSPDNPIVQMELTSTGGSWEFRYLSGTQDISEDVTFEYVAVDSELAVSNESTVTIDVSESSSYQVLSAAEGDELDADLGNQLMLGDETDNVFVWLDKTLDNGTDVVDNFELGSDLIDLRGILEQDDNVLVGDLIDSISAEVDGDDIVMTVSDDGREQTIVLEGVTAAFEEAGLVENNAITNELEMLTQVLKTDAA